MVEKNSGAVCIEGLLAGQKSQGRLLEEIAWFEIGEDNQMLCITGSDTSAFYIFLQVISDLRDRTKAKPCCNQEITSTLENVILMNNYVL